MGVVLARREGATAKRLFFMGVLTGVVYFACTLYWIGGVMALHGSLPAIGAYALMIGLALHLSLFVGLFAWLLGRSAGSFGMTGVWLAPWLWVASEWLRAWLGWDFPWVLLGSSQASVIPVVQFASVTGVFGLSALIATVSTAAAVLALSRRRQDLIGAACVAALMVAIVAGGAWRVSQGTLTTSGTPLRVGLLQGNVPQTAKQDPNLRDEITQRYIGLSRQAIGAGAQLVIWPEASTPFYFDLDILMSAPIRRLAAEAQVPFIIGTDELQRVNQTDFNYNTAVLLGADGKSKATYRKVRLVPFGEYVPFRKLLFFVGPLVESIGDFTPGTEFKVFDLNGTKFSVAICYEAVYGHIARAFVSQGAQLLTTITNDAWFERSSAAYQHFEQASLRAVEQGRYLVRAANTGISGAVDPYGRVIAETGLFESAATTVDVRLQSGRTIYNRIGDVVAWASLVMTAAVVFLTRRVRTASTQ